MKSDNTQNRIKDTKYLLYTIERLKESVETLERVTRQNLSDMTDKQIQRFGLEVNKLDILTMDTIQDITNDVKETRRRINTLK